MYRRTTWFRTLTKFVRIERWCLFTNIICLPSQPLCAKNPNPSPKRISSPFIEKNMQKPKCVLWRGLWNWSVLAQSDVKMKTTLCRIMTSMVYGLTHQKWSRLSFALSRARRTRYFVAPVLDLQMIKKKIIFFSPECYNRTTKIFAHKTATVFWGRNAWNQSSLKVVLPMSMSYEWDHDSTESACVPRMDALRNAHQDPRHSKQSRHHAAPTFHMHIFFAVLHVVNANKIILLNANQLTLHSTYGSLRNIKCSLPDAFVRTAPGIKQSRHVVSDIGIGTSDRTPLPFRMQPLHV